MANQWTSQEIMEAARAFQASRLILTAARLDLFTVLNSGPKSHQEVAAQLGLDQRATRIFLDALAAMDLLQKGPQGYLTPAVLRGSLASDSQDSILPMLLHMATLWERWSALEMVLRTGSPSQTGSWEERPAQEREAFIGAMHVIARGLAPEIVSSISLEGVKRILDVGGGPGTYAMGFLEAGQDILVTLFDLPSVIPMARSRLEKAGFLDRVQLVAGDFEVDPLPCGHDLVFLSAIVHQNDREQNRRLFSKCLRALVPGGRILVRDHIMENSRTRPAQGALFAVNMLVSTRGGSTYTFDEIREDLEASGFGNVEWIRKRERMDSLVQAKRTGGDPR